MPYSYEPHYFEDFEEGQTFTTQGRTVTETDLVNSAALAGDWVELHTNKEYAQESSFGQRVLHGPMTFVYTTGLMYRCGIVERTVDAWVGLDYLDVKEPILIGDTIQAEVTIAETTEVNREGVGFVKMNVVTTNQDGTDVMEGDLNFFIKKSPE